MATNKVIAKRYSIPKKPPNGFTLVELLIVVVIIGVLAAVLYPNYTSSSRKAKRSDAFRGIQTVSNRLEKFMTYCNSYTTNFGGAISEGATGTRCSGLGLGNLDGTFFNSESTQYSLNISCPEDDCMRYIVTATAQRSQLDDTECRVFSYTSTGAKEAEDADGGDSTDACWK